VLTKRLTKPLAKRERRLSRRARRARGRNTRTVPRTRNGSRRDISQTRRATTRIDAMSASGVWMTLTRMHEDLLLDAHHLPAGKTAA
jgi:hypothetical protein